jgi:hypothetical protein
MVSRIYSKVLWKVDQEPSEACRWDLDSAANEAWLNTVAFGGARTIVVVPNSHDIGDGPSIRVPTGATVLDVLALIANEYQKKPMSEEELVVEVGRCELMTTFEAWERCANGETVHRIEIMGRGIFFDGFHFADEPGVLRLSLSTAGRDQGGAIIGRRLKAPDLLSKRSSF